MELLRVEGTARLLGVSRKRVYQLIEQGRLESLRLGPRTTRVTRASIERFIANSIAAQQREQGQDIPPGGRRQPTR